MSARPLYSRILEVYHLEKNKPSITKCNQKKTKAITKQNKSNKIAITNCSQKNKQTKLQAKMEQLSRAFWRTFEAGSTFWCTFGRFSFLFLRGRVKSRTFGCYFFRLFFFLLCLLFFFSQNKNKHKYSEKNGESKRPKVRLFTRPRKKKELKKATKSATSEPAPEKERPKVQQLTRHQKKNDQKCDT